MAIKIECGKFKRKKIFLVRQHQLFGRRNLASDFPAVIDFFESGDHHRRHESIARQAVRMKIIHAVYSAKEHRAILAFAKRAGMKHIALQSIRQAKIGKSFGLGIEARQPLQRAEPQGAIRVFENAADHAVGKPVFFGVMPKRAGGAIKAIEAAAGSNPKHMPRNRIRAKRQDHVVCKAEGSEPEEALAILQQALNEIMRHTLFERHGFDSVRGFLRRKLCAKYETRGEQTAEIFKLAAKHVFASKSASW